MGVTAFEEVAVGIAFQVAPPQNPVVRNYRIRLLPWILA